MLRKLTSASRQVLKHMCGQRVSLNGDTQTLFVSLNKLTSVPLERYASNGPSSGRQGKTNALPFGQEFTLGSSVINMGHPGFGCRSVSCKKVKDKKGKGKKSSACSKPRKGPAVAECPEAPCRCGMPKELNTPTRVKMEKSKVSPPSKREFRNRKCKDGDCDFMDDDGIPPL